MKTVTILVALLIAILTLPAQSPIKKDLMKTLESVPSPPTTVKDAFAKIGADCDDGSMNCSAEKLFKPVDQETREFETEFEAQAKATLGPAAPGSPSANMTKEEKAEMKKKMKSMTKEEKMKMAMEMSKNMPAGGSAAVMDPPPIRAALDEWQKVYNETQKEFQRSSAILQEESKLVEEYEKSHSEIDTWETAEISKLPRISSGEMDAPDPAKVKEVKLKAADKHIALANKRLVQIQSRWREDLAHAKTKYTLFYQKLVAADYGVDSKNFSTKKVLSDAQLSILESVRHQVKQSRNAWEESVSWQARRVNIEKE